MSQHHQPSTLAALGRTWVEAWNARDLERVLTLYDDAAVMTSDRIPVMGFDASGTVRGKDALRAYWGKALGLMPELHFSLIDVLRQPGQRGGVLRERAGQADLRISAGE